MEIGIKALSLKGREKMSSVDQAWLRMDSAENLMMIVGVQVFDKPVDFDVLRSTVEERLLKFRRFKQKVTTDATGAWWTNDKRFDLDQHVVVHSLPKPGNDLQLQDFVASLATQTLDPERPLWQFHLVQGYGGTNALVSRIHHCIADGIALIGVLMSLMDGGEPPPSKRASGDAESNPWSPYLKPVTKGAISAINTTSSAMTRSLEVMVEPDKLVDYAQVGAQVIKDALKIALMPNDSETRFKGKPGTAKKVAWNNPLPLNEVKAVSKALGVSVNDVLLSCVSGALRRYLQEHGDNVDAVEIRAMVPVNLRPMSQAYKLGNRFGLVPMCLPVGEPNPIERVMEVHRRMEELKTGYQAMLAFAVLGMVGMTPEPVQRAVLDLLSKKSTAVMTNVPGPAQPIRFAGSEISRIMFWVPQSGNIGMGVSILSYNGGVQFGLITDSGMVPDPQKVIDFFEPEFERLITTLAMLPREPFLGRMVEGHEVDAALWG
jgi:diacylglycerol O-acyltransferase / wax synthase